MKDFLKTLQMFFTTIFFLLGTIVTITIGVLFFRQSISSGQSDLRSAIRMRRNPEGTQTLPDAPGLDQTLNDIEDDITR